MSLNTTNKADSVPLIAPQQVREARVLAAQSKRSITEVLEDQIELDAKDFLNALGDLLHYPIFDMDRLNSLTPAFDALSFSEAVERNCIALRNDSAELSLF